MENWDLGTHIPTATHCETQQVKEVGLKPRLVNRQFQSGPRFQYAILKVMPHTTEKK